MSEPEAGDDWGDVLDEDGGASKAAGPPEASPVGPETGAPAAPVVAEQDGAPAVAEAMRVAEEACRKIMDLGGFDVRVLAAPGDPVRIELQGPDAGRIIGRHGATLQALQYLVARIVGQRASRHVRIKVDVEGYRVRRENALRTLAQRVADQVVRERREIELEPMNPEERRVVHLALADDGDVRTESVGEGMDRRVCVLPADDEPGSPSGGSAAGNGPNVDE
ncbi:MAG: KH domain-containing protein [Deltaproteobacteria bacterium]|nr:KH domain-containing protein [Deltaproteobacteria bacterium]